MEARRSFAVNSAAGRTGLGMAVLGGLNPEGSTEPQNWGRILLPYPVATQYGIWTMISFKGHFVLKDGSTGETSLTCPLNWASQLVLGIRSEDEGF